MFLLKFLWSFWVSNYNLYVKSGETNLTRYNWRDNSWNRIYAKYFWYNSLSNFNQVSGLLEECTPNILRALLCGCEGLWTIT
jgi:hypothetical protein